MTAGACHISCQSGKWQGFVSRGDKVTQKGIIFALEFDEYVQHQRRAETQRTVSDDDGTARQAADSQDGCADHHQYAGDHHL